MSFPFLFLLFFLSSRQVLSKVREMESAKGSNTTISAKLQMIGSQNPLRLKLYNPGHNVISFYHTVKLYVNFP